MDYPFIALGEVEMIGQDVYFSITGKASLDRSRSSESYGYRSDNISLRISTDTHPSRYSIQGRLALGIGRSDVVARPSSGTEP